MAFRMPAFMVDHLGAGLSISAISDGNSQLTDADKRALIDFRVGTIADFDTAVTSHFIDMDFGAAVAFNRLVIPKGHTLSGANVQTNADDNAGFTSPQTHGSMAVSGSSVIDMPLTNSGVSDRYWRAAFTSASGAWELSELWWGERIQLADAAVQRDWSNAYIHSLAEIEFPSGVASARLALPRRRFGIEIRNLDPAQSDYTILNDVMKIGRHRPFWYWPPDDNDAGPFLVKLTDRVSRDQDSLSPQKRIRYRVELEMEEQAL